MNEERHRILDMLAARKVSVADADKLLAALGESPAAPVAQGTKDPKFLRVQVEGYLDPTMPGGKVNVRVPFNLLRAGVKTSSALAGRRGRPNQQGAQTERHAHRRHQGEGRGPGGHRRAARRDDRRGRWPEGRASARLL